MRKVSSASLLLLVSLALAPRDVQAIPAFARKTGMFCSACHEAWPRLNEFGQQFRDNGYRLRRGRDAPAGQNAAYWPIAFRTTVGYQWLRQTLQQTDGGRTTTQTGTFGFSGLDIHSAGTLADRISYFITYTPALKSAGFGSARSDGDLESAWAGFHELFGTTWLNARIGKHALDLPEDEHRSLTLTQGYGVYHFHPPGSTVTFEPGNNQVGLELFGHDSLSRLRYSVSLVNADGAPASRNLVSTPVLWGHLQGTRHFDSDVLPAVKLGAFGAQGWYPTSNQVLTLSGGPPVPVVGTDAALQPFQRLGAEAHLYLLSDIYPLTATGVVFYGNESRALIANGVGPARFVGGWAELSFAPTVELVLLARWERVRMVAAGTANQGNLGNLTALTGSVRYTLELSNRTEVAAHLELSSAGRAVDAGGPVPTGFTGLAGIDFVF